eukprot:15263940-Heterocapsa_arctica.AAC.1
MGSGSGDTASKTSQAPSPGKFKRLTEPSCTPLSMWRNTLREKSLSWLIALEWSMRPTGHAKEAWSQSLGSMLISGKDGNPRPGKTSKEPRWSDVCLRMSPGNPEQF